MALLHNPLVQGIGIFVILYILWNITQKEARR